MKKTIFLIIYLSISLLSQSQPISDTLYNAIQDGVKFRIKNQDKASIALGFNSQIWMRYMQMNPSTLDSEGNSISSDGDILLRRTTINAQLVVDRFTFFLQVLFGPQTHLYSVNPSSTAKPLFFFNETWGSYKIHREYLMVGMGLNMYNGISRISSASSSKTLTADIAAIANPNLITDEQSGRSLSLFFAGNIGSFAYRTAIAKPFVSNTIPASDSDIILNTIYHRPNSNFSYKSYIEWHFFDKESNSMPFKAGTYIGRKKILNVGAGFDVHAKANVLYSFPTVTNYYDSKHFAVDVFLDYPFANRSALTLYAAHYWSDYGPNYTMKFGVMDIYKNGISEYQYGTGSRTIIQTAFLLPSEHKASRLQPFYELTIRSFDALANTLYHHNMGLNYFVIDHKIKFTLQYENRPFYDGSTVSRKSMLVGQMQFGI